MAAARSAQPRAARSHRFAVLVGVLGVAVNVATVFLVRGGVTDDRIDADELEYWNLAGRLLDGGLHDYPSRRTLPFPLLVLTFRLLAGDDYFRVQLLMSALVGLTAVLVYHLVRRELGSERAARVASIGVVLWPAFARYGATLYSDSASLLTFLAFLLALPPKTRPAETAAFPWARWTVAGALLAVSVHMKPLYLLFTPIALALAAARETGVRRARAGLLLAVGCVLIMIPWSVYMSRREGGFILVSANGGETLAGGLNPELLKREPVAFVTAEDRVAWTGPGKWLPPHETGFLNHEEMLLPYAQQSTLLSERVVSWAKSHSREAAYLTARKLLYMWGIFPFWNGTAQTLLGNVPLLLLMIAAGVALWKLGHCSQLAIFWVLPVFSSLVACVSWGSWRFRMPGDVGLIALAAGLVAYSEVKPSLVRHRSG